MKKIIQLVTTLAVLIIMSLSGAVVANAAPVDDVYNFAASYKNSKGQATPVRDAGLSQAAQAWANSLAKSDKGYMPNPDMFPASSKPANMTAGSQVMGVGGSVSAAVDGAKASSSSTMLNAGYNTVGVGSAQAQSGKTYIVVNYATVVAPPAPQPVPQPAPAPVVVPEPVPAPVVIPEPAPVVVPEPAPVEQPQPKPVAESPKPAAKPTETSKPAPTASSSPKSTQSPTSPAITKEELAKEKAINEAEKAKRIAESERASKAELEAQETKAWQKQTVTTAGIGFSGLGALAFLLLPFTRQRKPNLDDDQSEPTVTLDDDDDDWNIGN